MRKQNLLKLAFTMLAMIVMTGAMAQILTDYSEDNATTMYQTIGTDFRVYVQPDLVYSPTYDAASNGNINPASFWTFTITAGLTEVNPADISSAINQNWVELNATALGSNTITAAEQFGAAGCVDASPQSQTIVVTDEPTAEIAGANANGWTVVTPSLEYYICNDGPAEDLTITITETNVIAALASYAYSIEKVVEEIDVNGNPVANTNNATTTLQSNTIAAKLLSGNIADGAVHTVSTGAMPLLLDDAGTNPPVRTRYTFTLRKPLDAAGAAADGIVSAVSHKSEYLAINLGADVTTYPFSATDFQVIYTVNLPPVTGPIYHIPNNFEQ